MKFRGKRSWSLRRKMAVVMELDQRRERSLIKTEAK
jgi:hypothetical protein